MVYCSDIVFDVGVLNLTNNRCFFGKIRLAIAVIKTSAVFIGEVPTVLSIPIIFGVLIIGFWILWIGIFIYLYSVGDISGRTDSPFATIKWD